MSMNLVLEFEMKDVTEDGDDESSLTFERFSAGITHSAYVGLGETLLIGDVEATVIGIAHRWQKPGSAVAPVTWVRARIEGALTTRQIQKLVDLGFHG